MLLGSLREQLCYPLREAPVDLGLRDWGFWGLKFRVLGLGFGLGVWSSAWGLEFWV